MELRDMMARWADQEDKENDLSLSETMTSKATTTTTLTRTSGTTWGIPKNAS
jgi:hypothetical protein